MPSRGFATAALLIIVALACLAALRRFERDRRLLGKLHRQRAYDFQSGIALDELSPDDRDSAATLAQAGVVSVNRNRCFLMQAQLPLFRQKRTRLALSGAIGALALAVLIAVLILRR
jgi:hypothetical protein